MAVTPFIKPIPNSKGILYTMQSAINDMTTVFAQDNRRFRMSKFALINIPALEVPNVDGTNTAQINSTGDDFIYNDTSVYGSDMVKYLATSFQNYCLNFEALLMSNPNYDTSNSRTVSERVFWKWMKEMGAIRFRKANSHEVDDSVIPGKTLFVEADEEYGLNYVYNRVVKYIADIEVVNTVQNKNAYSEFYIYIPTHAGSTPYVMFDSVSDNNYTMTDPLEKNPDDSYKYHGISENQIPNMSYHNVTADALDEPYLVGRHYDDVHPLGLTVNAAYDYSHDGSFINWEVSAVNPPLGGAVIPMTPGYWFYDPSMTAYAYYTDNLVEFNGVSIGDVRNRKVTRSHVPAGASVSIIRSNLDGIVVDFDKTHYKAMNENPAIHTFADFNGGSNYQNVNDPRDFSYNAILLYYEIYDPADPTNTVTNLFGIQFLSKPVQAGTYWRLPVIDKAKPDVFHKVNGNSFAHKVNLKFDTSADDSAVERSINDYGTFSLDLYVDALTAMRGMTEVYSDNLANLTNIITEVRELKELMINDQNAPEILSRINALEQSYIANQALFNNTNNIMGMIQELYAMYSNIINNNTELTINYNFDPMVLNSMVILNQQYNWKSPQEENFGDIISAGTPKVLKLARYTNYYRHQVYTGSPGSPVDVALTANAEVRINDTDFAWENGQVFDIFFDTRVDAGAFAIRVYTDAMNRTSGGYAYSVPVAVLDASYFNSGNDYRPYIRITCIDKAKLLFNVDKIR
jgi:hypothetical protein